MAVAGKYPMTGVVNLYLCWYGTLDTHGFPAIYFVGSLLSGTWLLWHDHPERFYFVWYSRCGGWGNDLVLNGSTCCGGRLPVL